MARKKTTSAKKAHRKWAGRPPDEPVLEPYNEESRPNQKWQVKFKEGGKWKRKRFKLKKEATEFYDEKLADVRNRGAKFANALTEDLKDGAVEAKKILGDSSLLLEAAKFYKEHLRRTSDGLRIDSLAEKFVTHLRDERGVGDRHLSDVKGKLGRFVEDFGDRHPADLTANEVSEWLGSLKVCVKQKGATTREILEEDLSPQSRRHYRAALRNFFAWCVENDFCDALLIKGKPPRIRNGKAPAIWTPTELARIIRALQEWEPTQTKPTEGKRKGDYPTKVPEKSDILANIVICAFAGLRQSEFERLSWEQVYLAHDVIDLSEITTKNTPSNRHVTIRPTLRAWLEEHFAFETGPCAKPNFSNRLGAFRRYLKEKEIPWKENALRHSFASYLYGELQDASAVAAQLGHSGHETLYKHYSKPVYRDHASAFWSITPQNLEIQEVRVG